MTEWRGAEAEAEAWAATARRDCCDNAQGRDELAALLRRAVAHGVRLAAQDTDAYEWWLGHADDIEDGEVLV